MAYNSKTLRSKSLKLFIAHLMPSLLTITPQPAFQRHPCFSPKLSHHHEVTPAIHIQNFVLSTAHPIILPPPQTAQSPAGAPAVRRPSPTSHPFPSSPQKT